MLFSHVGGANTQISMRAGASNVVRTLQKRSTTTNYSGGQIG
jgi:hypothetical protein